MDKMFSYGGCIFLIIFGIALCYAGISFDPKDVAAILFGGFTTFVGVCCLIGNIVDKGYYD